MARNVATEMCEITSRTVFCSNGQKDSKPNGATNHIFDLKISNSVWARGAGLSQQNLSDKSSTAMDGAFHLGLGVSGRLASTANSAVTAGAEATAATMRCKQQLTLCYESSPIRTARCHGQLCKQISRQSSMEQCMLEWVGAGMAVKAAACAAEIDGLGPAIPTSSPLAVGSLMCL